MANFRKTIVSPDRGVNYDRHSALLEPRQWLTMQQMRARLGVVDNFPGWSSPPVNFGGICSLLYEYIHLDGGTHLLVGGPNHLYLYQSSIPQLIDICGSVEVGVDRTFNMTRDNPWFPFQYGDVVYLTCRQHGLFSFLSGSVTPVTGATIPAGTRLSDGSILATARPHVVPRARSGAVLNDHICLLNTVENGAQSFEWAAEGRNDIWEALTNNDAGRFSLNDTPDPGVALYRLGSDVIAYKEETIIPITFIGGNEVFGRRQAVNKVGLLGPYALGDRGDSHLLMGPDRFYEYFGVTKVDDEIGLPINEKVYSELHPQYKRRVRTMWLRDTQEWLFTYPDINSTGSANRCVVYNTQEKVWYGPFDILTGAAMGRGRLTNSLSKVIDEVNEIIDSQSDVIIDEAFYASGSPIAVFGDDAGQLQLFTGQSANGVDITRILESGDQNIGFQCQDEAGRSLSFPPGSVYTVNGLMVELGDVAGPAEHITVEVGSRMTLNDEIVYSPPKPLLSRRGQQEVSDFGRANGRFHRVRFTMPNSARVQVIGYQWVFSNEGNR